MSIWRLVKLNFGRCPVHFGGLGIGIEQTYERVPSDTLFSAWVIAYARLADSAIIDTLLNQFLTDEPPFRLSSTFIYVHKQNDDLYYLPRPLTYPPGFMLEDYAQLGKIFKGLHYLPLSVWQRWYQGEGFTDRDRQELLNHAPPQTDKHLYNAGTFSYHESYEEYKVPKIAVDRVSRATNLYHTGFVQYNWQENSNNPDGVESLSGLYFLVHFPKADPEIENLFFGVLNFLGGEGIGGERSSGAGQFKVDPISHSAPLPKIWEDVINFTHGNGACILSLFWQQPLPENFLLYANYHLQERGGWLTSPQTEGRQLRRKSVQMFTDGSVFSASTPLIGQLADVTPVSLGTANSPRYHKIYRSGIGLSLSINLQESSNDSHN
jgi:CRISPR-associated protein Csm4